MVHKFYIIICYSQFDGNYEVVHYNRNLISFEEAQKILDKYKKENESKSYMILEEYDNKEVV